MSEESTIEKSASTELDGAAAGMAQAAAAAAASIIKPAAGHVTRIGIIGMGHVGAHVANAILWQGLAAEIYCCDIIESKVACEVNDLQDAMPFYPRPAKIFNCHADYEQLMACDVIVNAAGHVAASSSGRDGELQVTVDETKKWAPRLKGYQGVIVTIANPCDVVAKVAQVLSGIDPAHIIGSGTALDSARFRHALWSATGVNPNSITSWMLGEHGASQFACWSHVFFGATPLAELEQADPEHFKLDKAAIEETARQGGWISYAGKGCTEYSVANAAVALVKAVIQDEKLVTPCGTLLTGQYGESDIYTSIPCVVGAGGVERTFPIALSDAEQEAFHKSCDHVRANIEKVKCW